MLFMEIFPVLKQNRFADLIHLQLTTSDNRFIVFFKKTHTHL
jgi:hypothetical protein